MKMNNFNSLMAVFAGINTSSVTRLKFTWQGIPQILQDFYFELEKILSAEGSYRTYRGVLSACTGPTIPYLYYFKFFFLI